VFEGTFSDEQDDYSPRHLVARPKLESAHAVHRQRRRADLSEGGALGAQFLKPTLAR
jgi:hypothetical protein